MVSGSENGPLQLLCWLVPSRPVRLKHHFKWSRHSLASPLTAIEPQGFEKRARASMTGPWARLIGFGSRGYWSCEKLQTAFPTPEPGHGFKETGWRSSGARRESWELGVSS